MDVDPLTLLLLSSEAQFQLGFMVGLGATIAYLSCKAVLVLLGMFFGS